MAGLRKAPVQARSRARVERILEAAAALLEEGGPQALRPTVVARRAQVPVGSVYQYFADRSAILTVLVDRYFTQVRAELQARLAGRDNLESLIDGLGEATRAWYELHEQQPFWRQVLHGILTDKDLQALNMADSHQNGLLLAQAILSVAPDADPTEVRDAALVVNHLFAAALQLALSEPQPERSRALFESWLGMAGRELVRVTGAAVEPTWDRLRSPSS